VGNTNLEGHFNGAKVFVGGAAQVGQAVVVGRGEGVAQNQADNSSVGSP
jgi:hypothetical protein